jgi:Ser/Thr protein kinase RdoA (MazF antagonist)
VDPKIAARFNDDILYTACQRYDIAPNATRLLDGFESFIYEFSRPDGDYILRIGHSSRRSPDLIRGEVDWINYLSDGGTSVARAVLSSAGNLVEPIDDSQDGQFLCTAFVRAPGGTAGKEHINERLFLNYGRLLGRMHALARTYRLPELAWKRPEWDDPINIDVDLWMPEKYASLLPKYHDLMAHLTSLPRDPSDYGMIHQDAHLGNLFVDENYTLTLFDFDDCIYGHFIYDIAMVLFYIADWGSDDRPGFTGHFMPVFLQGYREHNLLDPHWLAELPHFLKLREIDLFAEILFMDGETPTHPWSRRYMLGRGERIEQDLPFIEFDWGSLGKYLLRQ